MVAIAVMFLGTVVEQAPVRALFAAPMHPYTRGLLDSIPHFETGHRLTKLNTIPGLVPNLYKLPTGCRFLDRCTFATDECRLREPNLENLRGIHRVACFNPIKAKD